MAGGPVELIHVASGSVAQKPLADTQKSEI